MTTYMTMYDYLDSIRVLRIKNTEVLIYRNSEPNDKLTYYRDLSGAYHVYSNQDLKTIKAQLLTIIN